MIMNRLIFFTLALSLLLGFCLTAGAEEAVRGPTEETENIKIDIVYTNDIAGGIGPTEATFLNREFPPIVGGAAALETTQIEEIEQVFWEDLMPECLWQFRVKDFGPLIVGIDSHGNSLYADVKNKVKKKLPEIYAKLGV